MNYSGLIGAAIGLMAVLPPATHAQMMHGGMMGGGRHGMINLVSPANSPTQIRRGVVRIGSYPAGMMGREDGAAELSIVLRLSGVVDADGLLTSTGNHFIFAGQLTTAGEESTPISIDQSFALDAGSAVVQAPLSVAISGPATITIDRIAVEDSGGNPFALPGINLTRPTPQVTPQPTPRGACTSDRDCDDGDPNTLDICMPVGCRHMPGHMGAGGGPMR